MKISDEKIELIGDTYTYGVVSIAMDWIANDMSARYENSASFFLEMLDGSMKHTLQKFSQE